MLKVRGFFSGRVLSPRITPILARFGTKMIARAPWEEILGDAHKIFDAIFDVGFSKAWTPLLNQWGSIVLGAFTFLRTARSHALTRASLLAGFGSRLLRARRRRDRGSDKDRQLVGKIPWPRYRRGSRTCV